MRIKERLQRVLWTIGRPFCEFDSRATAERVSALQGRLEMLNLHTAECDRRFNELEQKFSAVSAEYERRIAAVNADRLGLIRQIAEQQKDEDGHLWQMRRLG